MGITKAEFAELLDAELSKVNGPMALMAASIERVNARLTALERATRSLQAQLGSQEGQTGGATSLSLFPFPSVRPQTYVSATRVWSVTMPIKARQDTKASGIGHELNDTAATSVAAFFFIQRSPSDDISGFPDN